MRQQALANVGVQMVKAELPSGVEPDGADPVSLFFEAIAAIGMSDKEAAYTMAMDPAQLSRVKSRQARLPFDAMWRLPAGFWVELRNRIDDAKSLSVEQHARTSRGADRRVGQVARGGCVTSAKGSGTR